MHYKKIIGRSNCGLLLFNAYNPAMAMHSPSFSRLIFLQDTPIPGLYHVRDFIEEAELNPVRKTYGFKGEGRKTQTLGVRKGDLLLPGAYDYVDFIQEVQMRPATYSFKNCPRSDNLTLGIRDKVEWVLVRHGIFSSSWRMQLHITSDFITILCYLSSIIK